MDQPRDDAVDDDVDTGKPVAEDVDVGTCKNKKMKSHSVSGKCTSKNDLHIKNHVLPTRTLGVLCNK